MMKLWMIGMMAFAMTITAAQAKEEAAADAKQAKKSKTEQDTTLQEMTLTGTVQKVEKKKKDGTIMMTWFILIDAEGNEMHLPKGKVDEFEGSMVKITGTGIVNQKKGKEIHILKTVDKVEKLDTPAAAK